MIAARGFLRSRLGLTLLGGAIAIAAALVWLSLIPRSPEDRMNRDAERYVILALGLDQLKSGEIDTYFGPQRLVDRAQAAGTDISEIPQRAAALAAAVAAAAAPEIASRQAALLARIEHLQTVAEYLNAPARASFADELDQLYGVSVPPDFGADVRDALDELDQLLPGRGTVAFRLASFLNTLVIAPEKRRAVFEAALAQCRRQTRQHWNLPEAETLTIEWTRDVSAAWHRYLGEYRSSLRLNDLTIALVGQAVDLACHEGYPGHHAQFVLMDMADAETMAIEESVVLLRSPGSMLREGAANFAAELAFTAQERLAFEREQLFPLAGLPGDRAEMAWRVHQLITELASATVPVIRDYYDGVIDFNAASYRLEREAMITSPVPLLEFIDEHGTYSVGYTFVRDLIRRHLAAGDRSAAWDSLARLLLEPPADGIRSLQHGH